MEAAEGAAVEGAAAVAEASRPIVANQPVAFDNVGANSSVKVLIFGFRVAAVGMKAVLAGGFGLLILSLVLLAQYPRQELNLVFDLRRVACVSGTLRGQTTNRADDWIRTSMNRLTKPAPFSIAPRRHVRPRSERTTLSTNARIRTP